MGRPTPISDKLNVLLIDAYSRSNAGDGLLVDLSATLVREALGDPHIALVAMDPSTFPEFEAYSPLAGKRVNYRIGDVARAALTLRPPLETRRALREADVVLAVGGAYLRAESPSAFLKSLLSHAIQGPTARTRAPFIYLPQSIGPLPNLLRYSAFGRLRNASTVFVRDDRSLAECLRWGIRARRVPDLVILEIAEKWSGPPPRRASSTQVGLIARKLRGRSGHYTRTMADLLAKPGFDPLIQSRGRGNNDPAFYESLGLDPTTIPGVKDALHSTNPPAVTASVRLHGSLESILAGVPSIHLSYERKGWGAFQDLGIEEFVHHAWRIDQAQLEDQIQELRTDPSRYWEAIDRSIPHIRSQRSQLVDEIRGIASGLERR